MSRPPGGHRDPDEAVVRPNDPPGLHAIPQPGAPVEPDVLTTRADRAADLALLQGLTLDDPEAAAAFIRRFRGPVFGMAVSIVRDPGLAEDVAQEVFLRVWKAAATFDARRASVLTWMLTITRNAAIDAVRVRRPLPVQDETLDGLIMDTVAAGPGTEEQAVRRVEADQALTRLRSLPEEQARAVALSVLGGCTAAEIGEREGIPLGTAKTRIRTGLIRLRKLTTDAREGEPT